MAAQDCMHKVAVLESAVLNKKTPPVIPGAFWCKSVRSLEPHRRFDLVENTGEQFGVVARLLKTGFECGLLQRAHV